MRKQSWNKPDDTFDSSAQQPKPPSSGIAWLSQSKPQAQEDQKAESGSMSHQSMQRSAVALKMGPMPQESMGSQANDSMYRGNMGSDPGLEPNRHQFMLKNQRAFEQGRSSHAEQNSAGVRMLHSQPNYDNQIASQTSILQ